MRASKFIPFFFLGRLVSQESGLSSGMLQNASTIEGSVARVMCGVMVSHFGRQHLMGENLMMYV